MSWLNFWRRDRKTEDTQQQMRALYALSEDILTADSPAAIQRRLTEVLERALDITRVRLYIYDRRARTLEQVGASRSATRAFAVDTPPGPPASVAAMSFRNRTLLAVPDAAGSPFFHGEKSDDCPRAALFVPMQGPNEPAGLLELDQDDRTRIFTATEQAAAQHLANLASIALRGIAWRSSQEQLFHGQQLSAAGQLISSIAAQLKNPLEAIAGATARLAEASSGPVRSELDQLCQEAQGVVETVARMLAFSSVEGSEAASTDLSALLGELVEARRGSWNQQGMQIEVMLPEDPVMVPGSPEQLEGLFSNLFAFVLEELDTAAGRAGSCVAREFARVAHCELAYPSRPTDAPRPDPFSETAHAFRGGLSLAVCRSMARHYGGDMRWSEGAARMCRLELELPLADADSQAQMDRRATPRPGARQLTVLLLDPDATTARELLVALSSREHRVVPAGSTEEASDLLRRFRFDAVFCALAPARVNWLEIFEQARRRAGGFVLLAERYDSELAESVQNGEGHVLRKPVEAPELDRVLCAIEKRAPRRRHGKMES